MAAQDHKHCWHRSSEIYLSLPPQWDEVCCWCGAEQRVQEATLDTGTHGPHMPTPYPTAEQIGVALATRLQEADARA